MNLLKIRKIQIFNYYSEDFSGFDLKKLQTKFTLAYKKYNKIEFETFKILSDEIEFLENGLYKGIIKEYEDFLLQLKRWYFNLFNFKKFISMIKNLSTKQEQYKIKFLSVVFELNEINLNYEIKDRLLVLTKELYGELKDIINKSVYYEKLSESIIEKYILDIENEIENLENVVTNNSSIDIFKANSKKLILKVEKLFVETKFYIETLNFLKEEIPFYNQKFKDIISKDKKIFIKPFDEWNKKLSKSKEEIKYIEKSIENKDKSKLEKAKEDVRFSIRSILDEAKEIEEYNEFIINFQLKLNFLMIQIESEYSRINLESEKFFLFDSENKKKKLKNYYEKINQNFIEFKKHLEAGHAIHTSKDTGKYLVKIIELSKYFFEENNKITLDVKILVEQTNNINEIIYEMNNLLLKLEIKMKDLPEGIKFVNEQEFQKYQSKVSEFIEKYKDNFILVSNEELQKLKREYKSINNFYKEILSLAYLYNYVEWLIISLNKYRIDKKIDNLINLVQNNYAMGNLSESLRIAHKIVDLYKIYE